MAKYASHLDISRLFARALRRTKLGVWYSQGYNPHIYISFCQPLPLGYESFCESFDFLLLNQNDIRYVAQRLNPCLPEGLWVTEVAAPVHKVSDIAKASYNVKMYSDSPLQLHSEFGQYLERDPLVVVKKTKRGISNIDISPLIYSRNLSLLDDSVVFDVTLPAGLKQNLNPSLIVDNFSKDDHHHTQISHIKVQKKAMYCDGEEIFK
ncbi:MAG: TIGR03936 family radical SAM-associated protein [Oscillospiraceae bacterium]|nr:TIGR03936 family radical SAM-associated protein [Oscillospiraceae bacterium]